VNTFGILQQMPPAVSVQALKKHKLCEEQMVDGIRAISAVMHMWQGGLSEAAGPPRLMLVYNEFGAAWSRGSGGRVRGQGGRLTAACVAKVHITLHAVLRVEHCSAYLA